MKTGLQKKAIKPLGRGLSSLISSDFKVPVAMQLPEGGDVAEGNAAVNINGNLLEDKAEGVVDSGSDLVNKSGARITYLPLDSVAVNKKQPRQLFDAEELNELAASIKAHGVIQPIVVRKLSDDKFEIVAGERRFRASRLIELQSIPAIVVNLSDKEAAELAIIENIQRVGLTPIEEARAYERLAVDFGLSQQEIADRVGKDRASVANYLRLLRLSPEVIAMLEDKSLSMGHAKAIMTVKEPSAQVSLAKKAVSEALSVRALEDIVSRVVVLEGTRQNTKKKRKVALQTPYSDLADKLRESLATKVFIRSHGTSGGRIEISYFSDDELQRLYDKLLGM